MPSPAELLPQVYDELRRLAAAKLAAESPGQTLDATALVHEAWVRLAAASVEWNDRSHFLRTAATAMRRVLVDRARGKKAAKRDGGYRVELADFTARWSRDENVAPGGQRSHLRPDDELIALDDALERFAAAKPDHARLVELRFFAGLTGDEAAAALGISPATADRMWRYARAWLHVALQAPPAG